MKRNSEKKSSDERISILKQPHRPLATNAIWVSKVGIELGWDWLSCIVRFMIWQNKRKARLEVIEY